MYCFRHIKLGDIIHFEAYQLRPAHPSGIVYHASLAWTVLRPNIPMKRPSHNLIQLPDTHLFAPPSAGTSGGTRTSSSTNKGTSTRTLDLLAHPSTSSESDVRGIVGRVVAIPSTATAVLISEIDDRPVLVALERCRFFVHGRICPEDINT
jgi:hypothetical protein